MEKILIPIIVAVAFAGMAIWLIAKANKIRFPKGKELSDGMTESQRVIIIHEDPISDQLAAIKLKIVLRARQAAKQTWDDEDPYTLLWQADHGGYRPSEPKTFAGSFPELVIYLANPHSDYLQDTYHGLQLWAKAPIGSKRIPMLVVNGLSDQLGSLVIHEVGHLLACEMLGHPDRAHAELLIWTQHGTNSFEHAAMKRFMDSQLAVN